MLLDAVARTEKGHDLGGGVIKQRIARAGQGKSLLSQDRLFSARLSAAAAPRIDGPSALKGDFQNAILPLSRIRGRPNEHKFVDDARAGASGIEELAKVPWHSLEIVRYRNAILLGSQCQHRRVRNSLKIRVVRGEKINAGSLRLQPLTIA
jgi:hypothetical protein